MASSTKTVSEDRDDQMKQYFMKMTTAAKGLKQHLQKESHPEHGGAQLEAHLTEVRQYSQSMWDSLFEFVQFVTCSSHPVASKIKWLSQADDLVSMTYEESNCTLGKSYHDIMSTLTQMARIDPFCRPESYVDFFGRSTFGVKLDSLVLRQEELKKASIDASKFQTLAVWFVAGVILAIALIAGNEYRKKRVAYTSRKVQENQNYLDTQGISSISNENLV